MEWTDDYNRIVCELFAEQVRRGNRPNTHLNTLGYTEVSGRFYQMTGIELSKTQIKNKWDRLKNDWSIWQKLLRNQTGTGWDNTRGVINMDNEWWKKMKVVSIVLFRTFSCSSMFTILSLSSDYLPCSGCAGFWKIQEESAAK
jgi:hypothetical protein